MINLDIKVNFNEKELQAKIDKRLKTAQFALDEQVLKDSNYFIPKREGYLEASGISHSRIGEGHVEWNTVYARRLYYNPQFNFSKDPNPNASALWFHRAKAQFGNEWSRIAQQAYDKG